MRKCGVLCPVFSLPSPYGIGTFGKSAYEFVDQLKKAGQSYWQILPLGQTGYGDSPYQSFSTFAGNPYFIDLDMLREEGLLTITECEQVEVCENPAYIDYEKMYFSRYKVLRMAFARFRGDQEKRYAKFVKKNSYWLEDYALYMAVKDYFGGKAFTEWDADIRLRKKKAIARYKDQLSGEMDFYKFMQFCFARQWKKLKKYANKKGIEIIGDIPIYVAFDSADTWANPELFQLDDSGLPIAVAGCPPDAFCATGQLWGNPLYDWNHHKQTKYVWWMKRIAYCYELYDVVRIDHFRGFESYYAIPYGDPTAEFGHWEQGPGYALFEKMKATLGECKVIAEDLGFLTDEVRALVAKTGYPGMKIIEFAFSDYEDNDYLPHHYGKNSIVYTGTHDNETALGWLSGLSKEDKKFVKEYCHCQTDKGLVYALIRLAMMSVSETAVIPIQDYLELDNAARINVPSTLGENWKWRLLPGQFDDKTVEKMREMAKISFRLPEKKESDQK
ncbi:MAG: 4-alpha-glucanotransferase [Lachnospiraceae bacterium]|nr:4-alpha-glucanotransferase [Lachnospiraceae bacterium]